MRVALTTMAAMAALTVVAWADATMYKDVGAGRLPIAPLIDDPRFQADALAAHNIERALVGVDPLVWNDDLARDALAWANALAKVGRLQHAPQRTHGENLWLNTAGRRTVASMVGGWSIEKTMFIPTALHPDVSTTKNWPDVGHYSQMVWSDTSRVGCAVARGSGKDILVCRYEPIGNWRGKRAFEPR